MVLRTSRYGRERSTSESEQLEICEEMGEERRVKEYLRREEETMATWREEVEKRLRGRLFQGD